MDTLTTANILELKAGLYPLSAINIFSSNIELIKRELKIKKSFAPALFINAPILINLLKIQNLSVKLLNEIISIFKNEEILPIGIIYDNNSDKIAIAARKKNLTIFTSYPNSKTENNKPANLTIEFPIRSGQQISSKNGDLIITEQVGAGSEILAAENIHVYAPLRGRALAGTNNLDSAKIFCNSLEAELVAICGHYLTAEQIPEQYWKKRVMIYLDNKKLNFRII